VDAILVAVAFAVAAGLIFGAYRRAARRIRRDRRATIDALRNE
jgi:hypothetical protein